MPRTRPSFIALVTITLVAGIAVPTNARTRTPEGYRLEHHGVLAEGVVHQRLVKDGGELALNVAHVGRKAPVQLRTVSSFDRIAGDGPRLERTSSMCERVDCMVAINGDFYRDSQPVGAVAVDGELLRSPNRKHHNLIVKPNGRLEAGQVGWNGRLVGTDLRELKLDGVNIDRGKNDLVLYTGAYGRRTGTNEHGVELVLRFVAPAGARLMIGQTAVVRIASYRFGEGDSKIPARGAILSAHGKAADAVQALWRRIRSGEAGRELFLRVDTTPKVRTAVGGTPVLLRDGATWFSNDDNAFVRGLHPRTVVGWNRRGEVWLVTIDGRQPGYSAGASLAETAALVRGLGATDAINLDGGGSTTFVVGGTVVNRPSDRALVRGGVTSIVSAVGRGVDAANVERPVSNALVLVPAEGAPRSFGPPDLSGALPIVEPLALPVPAATDPASNPGADLPALIALAPEPAAAARAVPIVAALAFQFLAGAALVRRRRRLAVR